MELDRASSLRFEVEELLFREAYYVDGRDWDAWLELFTPDVQFWMPAWISEARLADDPETQLSLIHCEGRESLADRVFRIRTEDSIASHPLPRSCHVVSNVLILHTTDREVVASASWLVHQHMTGKGSRVHGGRYEYGLRREDEGLRIAAKKVIFLSDGLDVALDIYNI